MSDSIPTVVDLRQSIDFQKDHVTGSINSPLNTLTPMTKDIFGDPNAIYTHWGNLKTNFDAEGERLGPKGSVILVLCYDGETSRLATSILRARNYTAFSVMAGFPALRSYLQRKKR